MRRSLTTKIVFFCCAVFFCSMSVFSYTNGYLPVGASRQMTDHHKGGFYFTQDNGILYMNNKTIYSSGYDYAIHFNGYKNCEVRGATKSYIRGEGGCNYGIVINGNGSDDYKNEVTNVEISKMKFYGVFIINARKNKLNNLTIHHNKYHGINIHEDALWQSKGNEIHGGNISYNGMVGILNDASITLYDGNLRCHHNDYFGIMEWGSWNPQIHATVQCYDNENSGLYIDGTTYGTVTGSKFNSNDYYGVMLTSSTKYVIFTNADGCCEFVGNGTARFLDQGQNNKIPGDGCN